MRREETGDVSDCKTDAVQVALWGNTGNIARKASGGIDGSPVPLAFEVPAARAGIIEHNGGNARQTARECVFAIHLEGRHNGAAKLARARDPLLECGNVCRVQRAEGKIHEIHVFIETPIERPQENRARCYQLAIKNFDGIDLGGRGFFAYRSGDGGAMSQKVGKAIVAAIGLDVNTAGYGSSVRMSGVDTAIYGRNADLAGGRKRSQRVTVLAESASRK